MSEPSGAQWCARYLTSRSLDDLVEPFRGNAKRFVAALDQAGATHTISATRRPPERGYLMHGAWLIAREGVAPAEIGPQHGVDIDWTHGGDTAAARAAAEVMVRGYNIAYRPSLTSLHFEGRAMDITILIPGGHMMMDAHGAPHTFHGPANGMDPRLIAIGKTYGVIKLLSDPPHWSDDGH